MLPTVLIVDDERHTREGLQQVLEDQYDIYLAENADQAFTLMESETFDLILTDLRMPGKSGLKVIDKALALKNRPPVIMMTAYSLSQVIRIFRCTQNLSRQKLFYFIGATIL